MNDSGGQQVKFIHWLDINSKLVRTKCPLELNVEILIIFNQRATYVDWACMLQLREVREIGVLEVQVVLEDLDAHRNQSLETLVAPGVQEDP